MKLKHLLMVLFLCTDIAAATPPNIIDGQGVAGILVLAQMMGCTVREQANFAYVEKDFSANVSPYIFPGGCSLGSGRTLYAAGHLTITSHRTQPGLVGSVYGFTDFDKGFGGLRYMQSTTRNSR